MGYDDVKTGVKFGKLTANIYIPEINTIVLTPETGGYMFDEKTLDTKTSLAKQMFERSENKPTVVVVTR